MTEELKFSFHLFQFKCVAPVAGGHADLLGRTVVVEAGSSREFPFLTPFLCHRDLYVCLWDGFAPDTYRGGIGRLFLTNDSSFLCLNTADAKMSLLRLGPSLMLVFMFNFQPRAWHFRGCSQQHRFTGLLRGSWGRTPKALGALAQAFCCFRFF